MITKNRMLNLFNEVNRNFRVCCSLVILLLISSSAWAQNTGNICEGPIAISSLPYTTTDNTSNYGDDYSSDDRPSLAPDAVGSPSGSYLGGDDVVYAYTPNADGILNISVTGQDTWTGLFVFTGCPFESTVGGATNGSPVTDLNVDQLPVSAGVTYYIVISTWPAPQSTAYTLSITDGEDYCLNTSSFGSANVNSPTTVTISTCSWFGDYATITGVVSGYEYEFAGEVNSSGVLSYLTVRSGSADGPVIGQGVSPLVVTATNSDNLYIHYNSDANCGAGTDCITTTASCITCATVVDCEGVAGGSALPGTTCDDNDPATLNDQYNAACECVGEPAAAGSVCSSAIQVECNADPATYSSAASNGSNTTSCSMGNNGLWFSFMGTGAGITVNVSSSFDVEVSVNMGTCDALVNLACKDQYGSSGTETHTIESSEVGAMYYVYVASWASEGTATGDITIDIDCAATVDCEDLGLNIGDSCDDNNELTENDEVGDDCVCAGTPIVVWECPEFEANIGDACDDGNNMTENDVYNNDCECVGTPIVEWECPEFEANIGDACDDGNNMTENDVYNNDCECIGTSIAEWECPEFEANIGDACDDGNDMTENDVYNNDCECVGTPIVEWECSEIEANIGDPCVSNSAEDGVINEDCACIVVGISDILAFSFTMYPNPAASNESLTLTSNQSIDRYEVIDITGKLIDAKVILNQNEIVIALRNYSAGMYILKAYSGSDFSTQKMVVR